MSSIDRCLPEKRLRQFYKERLTVAAEKLRERKVRLMPLGPEPNSGTWYVALSPDEPEFIEFEGEQWGSTLRALWEAQGLPELTELAEPLAELAREMELGEDESSDVSPFIYVMY